VHKSKLKRVTLAVCFALLPITAYSAGLGKLTVISGLGEPLRAEIELVSTTPEELSSLTASIAPPEAYAVQGMERTAIHNAIQVELGKKQTGAPILRISTRQPVDDPFLDMLIQVDWATGRLLREYTVLLDPPGYNAAQPAVITTPAPAAPGAAKKVEAPKASSAPTASTASSIDEHKTRSGDTLNKIAREMQVEGVNLDQMLVGLYRANQQAFEGNMNRLKVGQIIRAPSAEELAAVSRQEAAREIRVQTADWNAYRNRLAGVVADMEPGSEDAGTQATSGKLKAATQDAAAPADAGPRDVVKLSKSDAGDVRAIQEKLNALQEENIARQNSLNEANDRVAALEKQIADLQQLLTIKNQTLAGMQQDAAIAPPTDALPDEATPAESAPEAEVAASEPTEAAPAEPPATQPSPQAPVAAVPVSAEAPGFFDSLGENGLLYGGAGGALLLLVGSWLFLRSRRKHNLDSFEQGILTAGGLKANTVFGNTSGGTVDTGDTSFLTDFSQSPSGMIDTHDVDPIAEAEVYMAYGRETQAEEILNDAIAKEPTRYELHLKLLEIFANRNDNSAFEAVAGELYSTLGAGDPVWQKVAEMGHKLEPNNPLYDLSQLPAAASAVQSSVVQEQDGLQDDLIAPTIPAVETDETLGEKAAVDEASAGLDFSLDNLSEPEQPAVASTELERAEPQFGVTEDSNALDFDYGSAESSDKINEAETSKEISAFSSASEDNGLDFAFETAPAQNKTESTEKVASLDLADTQSMTFESPALPEQTDLKPDADSDAKLSFEAPELSADALEMPDMSATSPDEASKDGEPTFELPSADLDFNLDVEDKSLESSIPEFESGADTESEETMSTESAPAELDFSNITLDLSGQGDSGDDLVMPGESTEVEEITMTHDESEEVNTKLDLVTAYLDMGDNEGARELLEEVLQEGGSSQRERAQKLLDGLS
jgi:pilus assembly protein FimV